jgi:ribosomal protein L7/L12
VLDALQAGQKINAIKIHRQMTGAGLKESKDFVEALARQRGIR